MSTVNDIQAALANLTDQELRQVEQAVRQQYRSRKNSIIYDDAYGMWTEDDQASAAAEAFALFDREEARDKKPKAR
jgi:hypothetical protein